MIVIITYENYPNGSPGAIRCASFAHAYANFGYNVTVLHKGVESSNSNPNVVSLFNGNKYKKYFNFPRNIVKQLNDIRSSNDIEAVIMYNCVFKKAYHWCRKNKIPCVCDIVEWYSKEQFSMWYLSIVYWKNQRTINYIARHKIRSIAVTSYLSKYLISKGCKSVCIPIVSSRSLLDKSYNNDLSIIKIIYAGSHLQMDNIPLIINSLLKLSAEERKRIVFIIFGLSEEAILTYVDKDTIKELNDCISIRGRKPNHIVIDEYKRSHFSILMRDPNLRVNRAGFPSKVVESMRMGVPVLCNYSSDLNNYLIDGLNSIIVDDLTEDSICLAIKRILCLTNREMESLRKSAIETIKNKLHPNNFKNQFKEIIQ